MTRVQLCGPLVIERGGERVDSQLPGRQGRLLFAYLAVNCDRLVSRSELTEALWHFHAPQNTDEARALIRRYRRARVG